MAFSCDAAAVPFQVSAYKSEAGSHQIFLCREGFESAPGLTAEVMPDKLDITEQLELIMAEDETNELLREVVYLLRIIARPELTQLRDRFEATLLTSPKRRRMWEEMDGNKTLSDIAKVAGTSSEAVRLFAKDIEENFPDLIEVGSGGPQRPRRRLI